MTKVRKSLNGFRETPIEGLQDKKPKHKAIPGAELVVQANDTQSKEQSTCLAS